MSSNLGKGPLAKKYRTKTTTTGLFLQNINTHRYIYTYTHSHTTNRVSVRKKIIINVLSEGEDQFLRKNIAGPSHLVLLDINARHYDLLFLANGIDKKQNQMTCPKCRNSFQKCNYYVLPRTICTHIAAFLKKLVFYRFQLLHILCCLLEMAALILSHFPSNYCLRNNAHWKCWENWYYNSQFPRAATSNIGTRTVVEEPKLKKEEQKIRLRLRTHSVFYLFVGFERIWGKPNIRPRSSQNLECQRAGPNPGRRAGTHSFNQLPKKILVFSYKIPPTHMLGKQE